MFTILEMTEGARAVAANDPHGWTLTIISISVVFCALLILYTIYAILGDVMSGNFEKRRLVRKMKGTHGDADAQTAAAIALALHMESADADAQTAAAIAMALDMYMSDAIHDGESYVITFGDSHPSPWSDKSLTFRKYPSL